MIIALFCNTCIEIQVAVMSSYVQRLAWLLPFKIVYTERRLNLYYPLRLALKKLSLKASLWPEDKNPCEWKDLFFFHSLLLLSYSQRLAYKDSF